MRTWATLLLVVVTTPPRNGREVSRLVERALLVESPDPHLARLSLLEEVENGMPLGPRARRSAGRSADK